MTVLERIKNMRNDGIGAIVWASIFGVIVLNEMWFKNLIKHNYFFDLNIWVFFVILVLSAFCAGFGIRSLQSEDIMKSIVHSYSELIKEKNNDINNLKSKLEIISDEDYQEEQKHQVAIRREKEKLRAYAEVQIETMRQMHDANINCEENLLKLRKKMSEIENSENKQFANELLKDLEKRFGG
ncbi:hypothetical protein [Undibacterium squillarum]|uniref:Uncharacterized protein n=1 Tax=Undibacterium squillarum TaxID=1131567 RepID=A0ABQ2Y2L5_9BURK|nr:hypothetical protein [Undibacterium squillarum]GGX54702.1 hypothetical protein GCM10010946_36640 [Undibacterium squillarum]